MIGATTGPLAALAPLQPLIDQCVHCGFCLPTCPSYLLLGKEMDTPRGRIYMMSAGLRGRAAIGPELVHHFDTCLGCMACETACPPGVRYAPLIEKTRATIERHHERSLADRVFRRLLFRLMPHPARLRLLAGPLAIARYVRRWPWLVARLPPRLQSAVALAPDRIEVTPRVPEETPAVGPRRLRVGLVTGCVQRVFFASVNRASARLLAAEGCDVVSPPGQGCCGALSLHAGDPEGARAFARALIDAFESTNVEQVVVNAAGCGSMMKGYGELLEGDPLWRTRARVFSAKVRDISETLSQLQPYRAERRPTALRIAYHDACHLAHAQGVRWQPRQLLDSIPGVTVVPLAESDICCGSAGIFNLVQPAMAEQLGQRKAQHLAAAGADVVVTSNPGCILQLQAASRAAGSDRRVLHLVELLDAAVHG